MKSSAVVPVSVGIAAAFLGGVLLVSQAVAGEDANGCSGPTCSGACALSAADQAEQERLGELVTRQRDELINLARTLAAEQKSEGQLRNDLAAARTVAPPPAPAAIQVPAAPLAAAPAQPLEEENRRLKMLLEIAREDNQKLEAKLRTASRVTDLVFRATAGNEPSRPLAEAQPASTAADEPSTAWPRPAGE